MIKHLTERTIYVSECPSCGVKDIRDSNPPGERFCECGRWVPYVASSYVGPDRFGTKKSSK